MVVSGRVLSFPREGIQYPSFPHTINPHFFHLDIDSSGQPSFHTSLPEFKGPIFTSEFGDWLAQATGANVYHLPFLSGDSKYYQGMQFPIGKVEDALPSRSKRRRYEMDHSTTEPGEHSNGPESVEMVPLEIGNEEKVEAYYESAFKAFQQINCRQIAKAYIKIIEPRKQVKYPYNGGRGGPGEKGDPEKTKPDWWPTGVVHREPDHLKKPDRIRLLIHIFRKLGKNGITADKLEEAGLGVKSQIKPREKVDILDEIYKVRRAEERYERGEADEYAKLFVTNRDAKTEQDLDEVNYNLSALKEEREVDAQGILLQTRPFSITDSREWILAHQAPSIPPVHYVSECHPAEDQQLLQSSRCKCAECSSPTVGIDDISAPTHEPDDPGRLHNYVHPSPESHGSWQGFDYTGFHTNQGCVPAPPPGDGCCYTWTPPESQPRVCAASSYDIMRARV
ncbi:hypothetical protein TMEN_5058 [Trichophyton mentagrophytes]|nr:hypothetical protein TMEN_5058 [Trichophyton mentagrophytes]